MPIQYSVRIPGGTTPTTVTLPKAGLTINGIFVANIPNYMVVALDAQRNAIIPVNFQSQTPSGPRIFHVHWTVSGQAFSFQLLNAGDVVFYIGQPYPDSIPLAAFAGVVISGSPTAAGSTSTNVNFPSAIKLTGIAGTCSTGTVYISMPVGTGLTLTDEFWQSNSFQISSLAGLPAPTSLPVTITYSAATTYYIIFYYA
jgi:hypothetical protein